MTNKNITHIRGLYDIDGYDRRAFYYYQDENSADYRNSQLINRQNDIRRFYALSNGANDGNYSNNGNRKNSLRNRKKSPNKKKTVRFQTGVQTSDALLFNECEFEEMMTMFQEDPSNSLFLFPNLKRRLQMKYFRAWKNRFWCVKAKKIQDNDYYDVDAGLNNESIDLNQNIDFDFEELGDSEYDDARNKSFHIKYGPDKNGIRSVSFEESYSD